MCLATLSGGDDKLEPPPPQKAPCHPGGWYAAQHGKFGLHPVQLSKVVSSIALCSTTFPKWQRCQGLLMPVLACVAQQTNNAVMTALSFFKNYV